MRAVCTSCRFCKKPASVRFVPGGVPGTVAAEAAKQEMEIEEQEKLIEQQRLTDQYRFDYEPKSFAWCEKYTLNEKQCDVILAGWLKGDDGPAEKAKAEGFDYLIDAAIGRVRPVYALCVRVNPRGECPAFEALPAERKP